MDARLQSPSSSVGQADLSGRASISPAATTMRASAALAGLSVVVGAALLAIAASVFSEVLLSLNNTPVALGYPLSYVAALLAAAAVLLLRPVLSLGALVPASLALVRRRALVAIPALTLFASAFAPIGGGRLLLFVVLAHVGFTLLALGAWPVVAPLGARAGAILAPRFFGMRSASFTLAAFLVAFALTNLVSWLVFAHRPHIISALANLFQARIFAAGHLYLPTHPHWEFFDLHTFVNTHGHWFVQFPFGHPLLLMLGSLAGTPWIVNPLAGALAVVIVYRLGREVYDERTARTAAALAAFSPFLLFMSGEFYSHGTTITILLLFTLFFARMLRTESYADALGAALCLGYAFATRTISSIAFSLPFAAYSARLLWQTSSPRRRRALLLQAAAALTGCAALLVYNAMTTGAWWSFGYSVSVEQRYADDVVSLTPWMSLTNTVGRLRLLNVVLFGWPLPSTLFVLVLFLSGARHFWDRMLAATFLSMLAVHAFWYYPGYEFGPRYLYCATGALALLTARGIQALPGLLSELRGQPVESSAVLRGVWTTLMLATLTGFFCIAVPEARFYSSDAWEWHSDDNVANLVHARDVGKAVVFVTTVSEYRSVFLDNALDIDSSDVVYARDLGERNQELMSYYPDRRYFLTDGTTLEEIHIAAN